MALKYRIKRKFQSTKKIVVIDGRAYMVDSDLLNNYKNANELIEGHRVIGERFETLDGKDVEFSEPKKETPKAEKPKATRKKRTSKASK